MLSGSIVALVTPFDEYGKIDWNAFEQLIEWHIEEGTDGLVLCGSTGEGATLSNEEKCEIFNEAVEIAQGRIFLIAGTGTNQTAESVELTLEAKQTGVDACIVIVPYYTRPTEEGCFQHFTEISKVDLPMIIYHHPGRTGVKLSADGLMKICQIPQVIAIKDASGDFHLAMEILSKTQIPFFSGEDSLSLAYFSLGASGSISIVGNVIPRRWKAFVDLALKEDFLSAREKFFEMYDLCEAMVLETNPQCVKYAVSLLGRCRSQMRLPLIEPQKENQDKIGAFLQTETLGVERDFY